MNFSKNKTLYPLWDHSGLPMWCIIMQYKCENCNWYYNANDGTLMLLLPSDVAATYPVLPKYATGTFHLHKDVSNDLEVLMRTTASAKFVSDKMYHKMNNEYTHKVNTYLSHSLKKPVPTMKQFAGMTHPLTDIQIEEAFLNAKQST